MRHAMDGVDERRKIMVLNEIILKPGDAVTIINRGDHFEIVSVQHNVHPSLELTDADIERLKANEIVFN